jgi:uncharacterized cupredoxin-like copper-binding protein
MRLTRGDREIFGVGTVVFALMAMVLALAALAIAAQSETRVSAANKRIAKLAASGVVTSSTNITLQEFSIAAHPDLLQSGKVTLHVKNAGSIIHELVLVRAMSASALPIVKKAGERSVGAVDEEAIPEADIIGETGDVPVGSTVTKSFDLTAGTYVVFCNIDNKTGGTVINHFL